MALERDRQVPPLDLHGAYLQRTDFSHTDFELGNLAGADFTQASLRGSNFRGAVLAGTILRGADLSDADNLTPEQLAQAVIDETTKLPAYLAGLRPREPIAAP